MLRGCQPVVLVGRRTVVLAQAIVVQSRARIVLVVCGCNFHLNKQPSTWPDFRGCKGTC